MFLRLIQIGIVGFWLVTTGWLVRSVWFPEGMEPGDVNPGQVADLFFKWNEQNNLVVTENGRRIGLMTMSGSEGIDSETGLYTRVFSMTGSLESMKNPNGGTVKAANWRLTAEFGDELELNRGQLSFRLPGEDLRVALELDGTPAVMKARIERAGVPLLEIERPLDAAVEGSAAVLEAELPNALPLGMAGSDLDSLQPTITARRATMEIDEGPSLNVYLLELSIFSGEHSIRAYISEQGEPLRIESSWGHEAVAEALLPLVVDL